jgi:O-antigen/teichoic acid export membrane protein
MAFTCGRVLYTARLQNQAVVRIDLACNIVQVIAMIMAAGLGGGPTGVAIAISAGTAVNSSWVGIIAYRAARGQRRTGRTRSVVLRRVIPLGVMGVLSKVYLSIDLVILGFMISGPQLGSYAAAVKLVTLANTLPGLLMASALPGMAAVYEDVRDLSALIGRLLHWQCAIALPIFGFIAIFAPTVTVLTLGEPYRRASSLVTILCAAGVIGLISQVLGTLLVAANRVRALLVQNTVAVVLNVALNLLLIRRYGAVACAWITVGTELVVCLASLWTVCYTLRLRPPLTQAGRAAIATVVAIAAGLAAFGHPLVGICGYTFFYFFTILALRAWPPDFSVAQLTRRRL